MFVDLPNREASIILVSLLGISLMFTIFAWQYRRAIRQSPLTGNTARDVRNMRINLRLCVGIAVAAGLGAIGQGLFLWL